jgi:NAD(P)H-binding
MSAFTPDQTLAFFGATGGVCNRTLALALKAGHHCTALARTPQKLTNMLRTENDVSSETIDKYLTVHSGHIKDIAAISGTLLNPHDTSRLVDTIIFGIGSYPKFQWSLVQPITLQDTQVCEDGTRSVFDALERLAEKGIAATSSARKPLFVSISTTGITTKTRDVPRLLFPLYHWTLHVPHMDKQKAEQLLVLDGGAHIRDCVVVRPTLMTDAAPKGVGALRIGWEWKGAETERDGVVEPGPQLGWSVGRKDVGGFLFEKVVQEGGWEGRCVSLTY